MNSHVDDTLPARSDIVDEFHDVFVTVRRPGDVRGSQAPDGTPRLVSDAEGRISIDHGALRFAPNRIAGWGREGLAYGPFEHRPGRVFSVSLLNGHNGSHSGPVDGGLRRRFTDWALGPRDRSLSRRLFDFARSNRRRESVRLWRWWLSNAPRFATEASIADNLVVGWFDSAAPELPLEQGRCLGVRTNGGETGRIIATVGRGVIDVVPFVHNVPTFYAIVATDRGATFFGASIEGVPRLGVLPSMRPLAIQRNAHESDRLFAGVHQSALGQVGFSADTRIYATDAHVVADWANWWTSAHVADTFVGEGPLDGSDTDHGTAVWVESAANSLRRTAGGITGDGSASLKTAHPAGLVAVGVRTEHTGAAFGVVLRRVDDENYWRVDVDQNGAAATTVVEGVDHVVARSDSVEAIEPGDHVLQVIDDGENMNIVLDDSVLLIVDGETRHSEGTGVGITFAGTGAVMFDFEAHPRLVDSTDRTHRDLTVPFGSTVVVQDTFDDGAGDLDGRSAGGGVVWRRAIGNGRIDIGAEGAVVDASIASPNPDRTAYLVSWSNGSYADLEVDITPPGSARDQGHKGRAGLVFWQDEDHYLIVNNWLDDTYPGASLSLFCRLGPFEDIFRAVWSNVGQRIDWGITHRLRIMFDGVALCARLDDDIVLYRTVADVHADIDRIEIRQVGIAVNWEWGDDTGSTFRNFMARS